MCDYVNKVSQRQIISTSRTSYVAIIVFLGCSLLPTVSRASEPISSCNGLRLLVSGWASNDIYAYNACTGAFEFTLDTTGDVEGSMTILRGPDDNLYIAGEKNDRILRFNWQTGAFMGIFVWDNPATVVVDESGGLDSPTGMAIGPDGNLYVASFNNNNILRYDGITGAFIDEFVSSGLGGLNGPDAGMAFGPDGNLYVPSYNNNRVLVYNGTTGAFIKIFADANSGISKPRTVLFRSDGRVLVSNEGNSTIRQFDATGSFLGTFASGATGCTGIVFGPDGSLYVTSASINRVRRYHPDTGALIDTFVPIGSGGLSGATFVYFWGDATAPVPTVSEWGLAIMILLVLSVGSLVFRRVSTVGLRP